MFDFVWSLGPLQCHDEAPVGLRCLLCLCGGLHEGATGPDHRPPFLVISGEALNPKPQTHSAVFQEKPADLRPLELRMPSAAFIFDSTGLQSRGFHGLHLDSYSHHRESKKAGML